jgi:hypothetical protein
VAAPIEARSPKRGRDRVVGFLMPPVRDKRGTGSRITPGNAAEACRISAVTYVEGGCRIVIDPQGMVRYAIHSKATSEFRRQRQHDAIECTLKRFWTNKNGKYLANKDVLRMLDE